MGVNRLALCTIISVVFWCSVTFGADVPQGRLELKMVQMVFRHGNRTPSHPYATDPNINETYYPYGWGELDTAGRERAYDLGRYLREVYGHLYGNDYFPGVVNITSTDTARTKMSAQLVAAGMFPPSNAQKWGSIGGLGQRWQPFDFNYIPLEEDDLLFMNLVPCPAYWEEQEKAAVHPEVTALLDNDPELVDALEKNGHVERSVYAVSKFYSIVRIEDFLHKIVPDWVKPFYPDRLHPFGVMYFKSTAYTRKMQLLWGGPLLKHILEQMDLSKKGAAPKLWLYSGHDDTVVRLGMTMRVWGDFYADFSNGLIIELHGDQAGNLFVKTLFHNDTSKQPDYTLTVEGCTELCPLEKLKTILDDVISRDHAAECQQMNGSPINYPTQVLLVAVVLFQRLFS